METNNFSVKALGAVVVIDVSGDIRYHFSSRKAGDHPGINELIRAVDDANRTNI